MGRVPFLVACGLYLALSFLCIAQAQNSVPSQEIVQNEEHIHFMSNNGSKTLASVSPTPTPQPQPAKIRPLLPKSVKPTKYRLTISVDFNTTSFEGHEIVEVFFFVNRDYQLFTLRL